MLDYMYVLIMYDNVLLYRQNSTMNLVIMI